MPVLGYKETVFPFSTFESNQLAHKVNIESNWNQLELEFPSYINTPSVKEKEACRKVFPVVKY